MGKGKKGERLTQARVVDPVRGESVIRCGEFATISLQEKGYAAFVLAEINSQLGVVVHAARELAEGLVSKVKRVQEASCCQEALLAIGATNLETQRSSAHPLVNLLNLGDRTIKIGGELVQPNHQLKVKLPAEITLLVGAQGHRLEVTLRGGDGNNLIVERPSRKCGR